MNGHVLRKTVKCRIARKTVNYLLIRMQRELRKKSPKQTEQKIIRRIKDDDVTIVTD